MDLAYIESTTPGLTDRVLADVAARLMAEGRRVAGVVPEATGRVAGHPCDMDLRVLPDGPLICISQNLGAASRGCRLDSAALEEAVSGVESRLTPQPDILILNKFGKHEAQGRGFRGLIGEMLAQGIPVLTAVNNLTRPAFDDFAGGLATQLPADCAAALDWCRERTRVPGGV